jgi:hypothetical protein
MFFWWASAWNILYFTLLYFTLDCLRSSGPLNLGWQRILVRTLGLERPAVEHKGLLRFCRISSCPSTSLALLTIPGEGGVIRPIQVYRVLNNVHRWSIYVFLRNNICRCPLGWVDIGTGTKVPLRFVKYLSKVTKINEKSVLNQWPLHHWSKHFGACTI